uniref:Delta-carbonic anhydrase n=1 Tax=Emiliania huxleyi TaxID=2903 RepID=Q0ZB86_EMIHU|nr:delta-carbonic anhydrase [Emiliania huxleyi]
MSQADWLEHNVERISKDDLTETPTTAEALEGQPNAKAVTIGAAKATGSDIAYKLSHLLALVVAGVIALLASAALADGRSVIKLKDTSNLPRLTALTATLDGKTINLKDHGLDYRADELLGPQYGVGLHHDSSGYGWGKAGARETLQEYIDELGLLQVIAAVPSVIATDGLKHPAHFLECTELKKAGLSAMSLAIIAEVASAVMIIFHGLALVGLLPLSAKLAKGFAGLVWFTLTAGFLIVVCLAIGVYETEWTCNNDFVPAIRLSDHFVYNWAFPVGYLGYACSLLVFSVVLCFTSLEEGAQEFDKKKTKLGLVTVVAGLFVGLVIAASVSVGIAASQDAFKEVEVDPSVNPCKAQKPYHAAPGDNYFRNIECMKDNLVQVLEQAGANVTRGYVGGLDAGNWRTPILDHYDDTDLCTVNVHWHLGAEHLSEGQYDYHGTGPAYNSTNSTKDLYANHVHGYHDRDAEDYVSKEEYYESKKNKGDPYADDGKKKKEKKEWTERLGLRCHHYDDEHEMFKTAATGAKKPYEWKHCVEMMVGETYEVHWPHSAAGACGTEWQYQTPFYDGVFCKEGVVNILTPLNTYEKIGVQGQVFTIVNSDEEQYQYENLIDGAWMDGKDKWVDVAKYTGSTTGTTRNNEMCSRYAPITWQVDRTCHMISAKSFDKLCYDMKQKKDDMGGDLYPHGAREIVADYLVANNQQSRK